MCFRYRVACRWLHGSRNEVAPDVKILELASDDEFLLLACDGIWDCLSSKQVTTQTALCCNDM